MNNSTAGKVTPSEIERVRKRHSNIPQDGLFEEPQTGSGAKQRKPKSPRSLAFARCPECHAPGNRLIGLIAHTKDQLRFRDHRRRVGKVSLPCLGSGVIWEGELFADPQASKPL